MRILFASAECVPFAKVGGLGDVVGALPKALAQLGHDVRVVIPKYGFIPSADFDHHLVPLGVPLGSGEAWCAILEAELPGSNVPIYFLDHSALFDGPYIYQDDGNLRGLARFSLLSRGALQLCRHLEWAPEVVHVHDWPTAPVPIMLNTCEKSAFFGRTASVLTIHNLAHQPKFPAAGIDTLGVGWEVFRPDGLEDFGDLNLFKGGCYHATMLTTVSPQYAQEIKSSPGGNGLDHVMRARGADLVGILNGIDEDLWNPATDRHLPATYSANDLTGKATCKALLQQQLGLDPRPDVPLLAVVSRLSSQKGIDVIIAALDRIVALDAQLVILGSGDPALETALRTRSETGAGKFYAWIGHHEPLAHRLEAAADFFLMPSRFEPCGLNQLYSQRYGTLPIVRATGGLVDTVEQCDPTNRTGTGFKLYDLGEESLIDTVRWAIEVYREDPALIRTMQLSAMQKDSGWSAAAKRYEEVYRWAVSRKGSAYRR